MQQMGKNTEAKHLPHVKQAFKKNLKNWNYAANKDVTKALTYAEVFSTFQSSITLVETWQPPKEQLFIDLMNEESYDNHVRLHKEKHQVVKYHLMLLDLLLKEYLALP